MKSLFIILIIIQFTVNVFSFYQTKECGDLKSFKCYNGGSCIQIAINSTSNIKVCSCKPGYTGQRCEKITMPCSPDPCLPNGYCNSGANNEHNLAEQNVYVSPTNSYFCRCKPGFTGYNCQEHINNCVNSTCSNGGLCINGVNSYTCDCPWPYTGRYCETRVTCASHYCKNNSTCVDEYNKFTMGLTSKCVCKEGYEGKDCSTQIDPCQKKPCLFGGKCLINNNDDYKCRCPSGRFGKNCQLMDICHIDNPCKNNSTCLPIEEEDESSSSGINNDESSIIVDDNSDSAILIQPKYTCQCKPNYTGSNCDIYLNNCINGKCQNSKVTAEITTTSRSSSSSSVLPILTNSNFLNNGSFVLILNLTPDEFKKKKYEIIQEFSKQMGIFMLIKKDTNAEEMIYPYEYSADKKSLLWTKVYFIIIFACIDGQSQQSSDEGKSTGNLCLNDLNSLNDIFNFVTKLKQAANLPNYVSNITYEANEMKSSGSSIQPPLSSTPNNSPLIIICVVVTILVIIIFLLGMIVRQQQIRQRLIKAPIWFPPFSGSDKLDINTNHHHQHSQQQNGGHTPHTQASSWSFQTSMKNFFKINNHPDSPQSDENGSEKPLKMRRVENNNNILINTISSRDSSTPIFQGNSTNSSSNCTTTSEYLSSSLTPPSTVALMGGCVDLYYPSPPESLPDFYSNIKGPQGLTPIMCVIMNHKTTSLSNMLDLIDTLNSKGADLNMISTSNGETALHLAIRNGLYEVAEKLINYGADITIFDKQGRNVLHTAVGSNQYSIIKLLFLKFGDKIDIDAKTNDNLGESALISASRNSFNEIIKLLISYNVTINSTDNNGQSALHWCAKVNNCQGAILLLENGANINLQDENEKTPLSVAIDELNTNEIIQLLIKYQAFVSSEDEKLIEFKQKLLNNNNKNINFLKQFKDTNLTMPQNKQAIVSRQPNMKIEKEVFDKDNQTAANRKRKLNTADVMNNKSSKATRKTPEISLQNKLKSENNLTTSFPQQSNNLVMSKSIQDNLNNYNSYDFVGPNHHQNGGFNNNYQFQNYQSTNSNYSNYPQYEQPQYQQPLARQQPQDYSLYNDGSYSNYQQQQQQNYQNFYNSNTLLTANTTNTAYF